MAIAGDCNKCGFPVDEAAQVVLGDQLLHPSCHGRGALPRAGRRNAGSQISEPAPSVSMECADKESHRIFYSRNYHHNYHRHQQQHNGKDLDNIHHVKFPLGGGDPVIKDVQLNEKTSSQSLSFSHWKKNHNGVQWALKPTNQTLQLTLNHNHRFHNYLCKNESEHGQGVGALYIVMDALKRRRAEEKERAERQRQEEEFHNKMNRGRQILPPL